MIQNDDTISRQAAIDAFYEMASDIDHLCTVGDYVHVLEGLSSAQPEIIRCKDCKYYKYSEWLLPHMSCHYLIGSTVIRESDDFCSRAERWEQDD